MTSQDDSNEPCSPDVASPPEATDAGQVSNEFAPLKNVPAAPFHQVGVRTDAGGINPYQPPSTLVPSTSSLTNRQLDPALIRQTSALPDADFWVVAFMSIGVSVLATALTGGLMLPFVLSACGGVIRVCLIYERRARIGLLALPANGLLLTSSLVTLCLLVCCVIAFCCVCATGAIMLPLGWPGGMAWTVACVVAAIVAFFYLFRKSVLWAVR